MRVIASRPARLSFPAGHAPCSRYTLYYTSAIARALSRSRAGRPARASYNLCAIDIESWSDLRAHVQRGLEALARTRPRGAGVYKTVSAAAPP